MKRQIYAALGYFWILLALTACSQPAAGPQTWLDRPLDNSIHPQAALTLQAHASDANGIASFEFYVENVLLSSVSGSGGRLSEAAIEWMPPAPGNYTIKARAINRSGNPGGYATSQITINAGLSLMTPTSAVTATPSAMVDANPLCRLEQLSAPELLEPADGADTATPVHFAWRDTALDCHPQSWRIDISELADFSDVGWGFGTLDHLETEREWPLPAGLCYYWRVLAYIPDEVGPPSAARRFCIPATPTATFTPTLLSTATITPMPPATFTPTLPPAPTFTSTAVPDITPPFFIGVTVSPDKILTQGNGCSSYARTTLAEAHVVDAESPIASVWAQWSVGAESGKPTLSSIGGDYYQVTIGPVNTVGTLYITLYAQDMAGNIAQSSTLSVNVQKCVQ